MKKLLFVLNDLTIGGPQKGILALLDEIDYSRFTVTVLLLKPEGILRQYINQNVRIEDANPLITAATIPINNTIKHLITFLKHGYFDMFASAIISILKHLIFKKNMNQERQAFWLKYNSRFPIIAEEYNAAFATMFGLTTYYVADCVNASKRYYWIINDYRDVDLNRKIDEYYLKKMDGALSDSQLCTDIFIEIFPFMCGKVKLFYNLLPIKFYEEIGHDRTLIQDDGFTKIISVCRLDPLKGIDLAIKACEILVKRNANVKWYILGNGKEHSSIEKIIQSKGLSDRFILLGFQLNTLAFLKQCDIFVHPTLAEGKSIAVDEAKFAGKPIVATNYPVVREQIQDGINGIICEMNGQSMADVVERLLSNPTLREKLAYNCREKIDNKINVSEFFKNLT